MALLRIFGPTLVTRKGTSVTPPPSKFGARAGFTGPQTPQARGGPGHRAASLPSPWPRRRPGPSPGRSRAAPDRCRSVLLPRNVAPAGARLREPGPLARPSHPAIVPLDPGCHLGRDTAAAVERAGFTIHRAELFDPFPRWVLARPMLGAIAAPRWEVRPHAVGRMQRQHQRNLKGCSWR